MSAAMTTTDTGVLQWLQLLQLASPSLPIGGFAWSQGLEGAIEQGWLKNEADFSAWVQGVLQHAFVWQEIPLLARLHAAAWVNDAESLQHWNAVTLALRETSELRQEDHVHRPRQCKEEVDDREVEAHTVCHRRS